MLELETPLAERLREYAHGSRRTKLSVVSSALVEYLDRSEGVDKPARQTKGKT